MENNKGCRSMGNSRKIFIIGLDGATFNVINPLIKKGKLPNLTRIMEKGVYGYLDSTLPPFTPVAWPAMFTGKLPGKHGVFDFSLMTRSYDEKKAVVEKKRVNSSFIKSKSLWKLLSEAGKRCIVIDVPMTYPPTGINGLMISRVMSTRKMKVTYPKGLYYELTRKKMLHKKYADEDIIKEHQGLDEKEKKRLSRKANFQGLLKNIDDKVKLIRYLDSNYQWDFFMAVFMEPDLAGHGFWQQQKRVERVYRKLDQAIGEISSFLPEDCLKVIVSDHGFKGVKGVFFLDEWLFRQGYVKKTVKPDKDSQKLLKKLDRFKEDFHKRPGAHQGTFKFSSRIDYGNSLAYLYSATSYGIRVNLKGRDPRGIVESQDYQDLRAELIKKLKEIKNPLNGERIFEAVLTKEQVIGEAEDDYSACDIYLLPNNMNYIILCADKSNAVFRKKDGGWHRKEGIFFALGDEFKTGFYAKKLSIIDVTPTILHLMDIDVPEDVDGEVRREIFASSSDSYKREVRFGKSSQKKVSKRQFSKAEEEKLKQRLRALGYIE